MTAPGEPGPGPECEAAPRPVRIVHLRRAEYEEAAARAAWHRRGYATLGPVEGHDPYERCPHCSTDTPPPRCPCGAEPAGRCPLAWLLAGGRPS